MADLEEQQTSTTTVATTSTVTSNQQVHSKAKEKKAKNPRSKPSHPPTSEMVTNAIKGLKEIGGFSLQAFKKFVAANYKDDAEKVAPFIKKYLKSAVASGLLVQTKGKGASGSFKRASFITSTKAAAAVTSVEKKNKKLISTPESGKSKKNSKISIH